MRRSLTQLAGLVPFLGLALLAFLAHPDLLRDGDQARMLAGALRLAGGDSFLHFPAYAYDRSWLAYLSTAGVFRLAGLPAGGPDPLALANLLTRILFWGAWLLFLVRAARRPADRLAAWCVLAAPAGFLASVYWNATGLSSALVALGAVALARRGGPLRRALGAAAFGAAAGMRVDVILLAPLLLWLFLPPALLRGGRLRPAAFGRGLAPVLAMAAAVLLGRLLAPGGGMPAHDFFFDPRVVAGYAVFGAGGILIALLAALSAWRPGRGKHPLRVRLFRLAGPAALLAPWLFYAGQLHTPRYLLRGGEAVLLLACSPRGRAWLARAFGGIPVRRAAILAAATLPLLVGLRMPFAGQPRPTVVAPGLYPTGDGLFPMGGLAAFAVRLRRAEETPIDHNTILWRAIREADWPDPADGPWPVVYSPQIGLFDLHAARSGARLRVVPVADAEAGPVYAETRMMIRADPKQPEFDRAGRLLALPAVPVSPSVQGLRIVRLGEGDRAWSRDLRLLRRLFDGAEFRIRPAAIREDEGHTSIWLAEAPFTLIAERPGGVLRRVEAERDAATGLYHVRLRGHDGFGAAVRIDPDAAPVRHAVSVFPDWMRM